MHAAEKTWQVGVNLFKQGKYVVTHPQLLAQAAKMGARGVSTLGKLAFGPSDPPTRFKGPLTRNKLGVWSRPVSLDAVKTIGRATGSTVNDVLFTAMLGGLRRYLEMHGENTRDLELRATVPVNLRDPERALELGNHFGLVFPALPVGVIDPLERIRLMREEMNRIKSSPEAMITLGALHAAAVAPQDIQDLVVNFLGSKTSAVMTNVPGPRQKLFLAGAPLKHIIFWVPQSGRVGMGISIFSYAGEVIMGIAADTGLVPDPENIIEAFHQEFDMLLEQARNLSNDPQTATQTPSHRRSLMHIPSLLLKQLYTFASLENIDDGVKFSVKNRLSDATLLGVSGLQLGDTEVPLDKVALRLDDGRQISPTELAAQPVDFPLRRVIEVVAHIPHLPKGKHKIELEFDSKPFGKLRLKVADSITDDHEHLVRIPRNKKDDYGPEAIKARQKFVKDLTGVKLDHVGKYSIDPHGTQGNIEHFTGIAQIPLGIAGPITLHGEHAQGDFLIPMATTEGTLVASYNRGIKLLNLCGGVKTTVIADAMQRAPVFELEDARAAREFVVWVKENFAEIASHAEATSSVAKLQDIDPYLAAKFAYLRFNFTTGDAAGQNMVGRATFAACSWILDHYKGIKHFYLESNFATDKKASQVNIMRTRGKRVVAEAVIKHDILQEVMRVETESLAYHANVANVGSILSGANNNGLHSANAITAIFIATGQDVANVAESSAGIIYLDLLPNKDLYISITIPSLIVATFGGGTGLTTQQECLKIMGCSGRDKVKKLAEIIAGVVLAGELSLASAISSSDWVSSHEQYGRNR